LLEPLVWDITTIIYFKLAIASGSATCKASTKEGIIAISLSFHMHALKQIVNFWSMKIEGKQNQGISHITNHFPQKRFEFSLLVIRDRTIAIQLILQK
jgi:hypothetical protein